jgi:hypothetical protein
LALGAGILVKKLPSDWSKVSQIGQKSCLSGFGTLNKAEFGNLAFFIASLVALNSTTGIKLTSHQILG